jgi:hypothetical protein
MEPYEPMKRTTTALKQEKEEGLWWRMFFTDITEETKQYYCKCTIENDGIFNYATSIIIETEFRKANTYFI